MRLCGAVCQWYPALGATTGHQRPLALGCGWATVQDAAQPVKEYQRKGDVCLPQDEARWQVSDLADLNQRAEDFRSLRFYLAT